MDAHQDWSRVRVPSTQPKGTASGPTLRTGSVVLVQANHSPLFTSSPARFGSRPPSRPPLCAAIASSGRFQRNGRLWGSAEYGTRGLSVSKDEGFSIVAPGAAWHPGTLPSWANKAVRSGWQGKRARGRGRACIS